MFDNIFDRSHSTEVTMVQSFWVSQDGVKVEFLDRGAVAKLPSELAAALVRDKIAVAGKVAEAKIPQPVQAPESNKIVETPAPVKAPAAPAPQAPAK